MLDPLDRYERDEVLRLRRYVPRSAPPCARCVTKAALVLALLVCAATVLLRGRLG